MKRHGRVWIVLAVAVMLIAGHGIILYYLSSYLALSVAVIAGVTVLVIVKHLGLLAPLYAALRKAVRRTD